LKGEAGAADALVVRPLGTLVITTNTSGGNMTNEQPSSKSYEKWLAIAVWLALLAALLYTSGRSTTLVLGGSLSNFLQLQGMIRQMGNGEGGFTILAVINLVLVAVLVSQIVGAWLKFVTLTTELVISYAQTEAEQKGSLFFDLLVFPMLSDYEGDGDEDETEPDPVNADSTLVSDVLQPLAYAWVIIILTPAMVTVANVFFS